MKQRLVEFDVDELLKAAVAATNSKSCHQIEKFPDGMYNKAFYLTMDDGRKFIAKIPNPNAGLAHYTTASEVATMDFMRIVLKTPVPKVHARCSNASKTPVKSEYIIMDMVHGVPLETLWPKMDLKKKAELIRSIHQYQRAWMSVSFSKYGSLYYATDLSQCKASSTTVWGEDGQELLTPGFEVGPATGRERADVGRLHVSFDRTALEARQAAIGHREAASIRHFDQLPKSPSTLCGPGTYEPTHAKKLKAIDYYLAVSQYVLPTDEAISRPHLWHADLHEENIYVDPEDPARVTAIIDWQSTEVAPLFSVARQPYFLDHDGPSHEGIEPPVKPDTLSEMEPAEQYAARILYRNQGLEAYHRALADQETPALYRAMQFRGTPAFRVMQVAEHLLVDGEAQFLAQKVELEDMWDRLPRIEASGGGESKGVGFPFQFSLDERAKIEKDLHDCIHGMQVMQGVRDAMGDLFPEKGVVRHDEHDEARNALDQLREQVIEMYAKSEREAEIWRDNWPFDDS